MSPKIFWNEQRSFVLPPAFAQTPMLSLSVALSSRFPGVTRRAAQHDLKRAMRQMASLKLCRLDFLAGAVLLLRRSAVLQAGGLFDPDYFMFFEDSDLSLRLRRSGYELAMLTTACAVHEYRHKAFKADLMAAARLQYFSKRFPAFFRWSAGLTRVTALSRPMVLGQWFTVLPEPVRSAAEFARLTGGAGVLAFSPSMLMMPAIFRPDQSLARCLDELEWSLLEPAMYVALLTNSSDPAAPGWVCFERAAHRHASNR